MLVLYESVTGYSIFFCNKDFANSLFDYKYQNKINEYDLFSQNIKLKAFAPFRSTNHALKECFKISRGLVSEYLEKFILNTFDSLKNGDVLGVTETKLAINISKKTKKTTTSNEGILELTRGIRFHFEKISKNFFFREIYKAQCSVSHLYSQSKMKLNLEKTDSMISQSNFLIEQLDNDINFFVMLCKEWYGWHFPELNCIVKDNYLFALIVKFIGNRRTLTQKKIEELEILIVNEFICKDILDFSKMSIGSKIETSDLLVIQKLCSIIINLFEFRNYLNFSLRKKVELIAPNLNQIIGENLVAKLISKAGSLQNLTRFPASTIQVLGSEKALFKALKHKVKTPKFGILFSSNLMRQLDKRFHSKFSRYLANKCSLAIRIDYFSKYTSKIYGKKLKENLFKKIIKNKT